MNHRALGFWVLVGVIGVSIVFGMIVGARLNAPRWMLAAPGPSELQLAQASSVSAALPSLADVVEAALPAVVSVTSAQVQEERGSRPRRRTPEDFFRFWFFGEPEEFDRRMPNQPRIGEGSGFIISSDGYILTNYHVVESANSVRIRTQAGREYKAEIVGTDAPIDLALLKIDDTGLPTLPLGDSSRVRVGEWVIAIGNPHEFQQTVTVGVVSGKERRVPIGTTDQGVVSFIQTDAAINFGNSGGPLLDARGNVIGINTAIRRANFAEGIGFALPINDARNVVNQLREQGQVRRGFIGITMNQAGIDEEARAYYGLSDARGVIVDEVRPPEGPAGRAGIKAGDVILKVDGETVADNVDLISKIASRKPGDKVRLEVFRKEKPDDRGRVLQLEATLADREEELLAQGSGQRRGPAEPRGTEEGTGFGLTLENLDQRTRERLGLPEGHPGVLVTDVSYDSEAGSKGVTPDMIITSVNDRPVRSVTEWGRILGELRPGAAVKLGVMAVQPGGGERRAFVYLRMPGG